MSKASKHQGSVPEAVAKKAPNKAEKMTAATGRSTPKRMAMQAARRRKMMRMMTMMKRVN